MSWGDEDTVFRVVINHEEQYSIWPDYKPMPAGWRDAGKSGKKAECLDYIDEVWIDMRPLSLREAMAAEAEPRG
ncbi:MbtH family protein [Paraburkholderia humisilvae]|uniref:Protein MbtH n=1 Tax=Paraburkholderia humisilvae TaxID=627669 RepID=A0A6J5EYT0_9BURK|nr:MbtH family NRPS accessory protein [Paraburkholderia humisilvae]CAB3771788.1 Protein MbtH [Paraburkholderia humisilvae]